MGLQENKAASTKRIGEVLSSFVESNQRFGKRKGIALPFKARNNLKSFVIRYHSTARSLSISLPEFIRTN